RRRRHPPLYRDTERVPRPRPRRPQCGALLQRRLGRLGRDRPARALPACRLVALPARLDAGRDARRPLRPGGEPMSLLRPRLAFLAAFLVALSLVAAKAALATFVSANCNYNAPTPSPNMYRDGSVTVSLVARYEGYHWGGGCWNDNDVDEGPNEPLQTSSTGGEGW